MKNAIVMVAGVLTAVLTGAIIVTECSDTPNLQEMQRRYEWFKNAAASLNKLQTDIGVYETRLKTLNESYTGKPRSDWPRDDRQLHGQIMAEVAGVKAQYNALAANYNAKIEKWIWVLYPNVDSLPQGADKVLDKVLRREYKPYQTQ